MRTSYNEVPLNEGEPVGVDFSDMNQLQKVKFSAEDVLRKENAFSPAKTLSGRAVFAKALERYPDLGVPENTFLVSLSTLVKDPTSGINCPGRKKGYYFSRAAEKLEKEIEAFEETETPAEQRRKEEEKLLYPILLNWLLGQRYRAAITATGRSHGWWGNPDITGINSYDAFGNLSLDIITIEVKPSMDGWRQWIFEAVSHRRFANRSYFSFAHPAELIPKLPPQLRYYAELYRIGVLVVAVDNRLFSDLETGRQSQPLPDEDVDIIELYSAPYSPVQPNYQKQFLESLKIKSSIEIARWGEGIDQ